MELAYLTTEYPAVSHTFIRREILGLEKLGHVIHRYSIQDCKNISDPVDELERQKTFYCLSQGISKLMLSGIFFLICAPIKSLKALRLALDFSRKSERGIIRHLAYFLEASLLLKEFNRQNIKHVHVHFGTNSTTVALLVSELGGPSYSFTVHGPDEFDAPIGFSLAQKITNSVFTVGVSQYCSAQLKRWATIDNWPKIKIVHCTVSDDFFEPVSRIADDSHTIVCVGRLSAQKGHLVLLDAAKKLFEQGLHFKVILVGDGEFRQVIENCIQEYGLEDNILITGWVGGSRIKEILTLSRGMVLPSFAEGLPVVLMEALALKRPVVTTYVDGIPELIKDGDNGFLTISGDVESLADGISKLLNTPAERLNQMGDRGHELVKSYYNAQSQIPILEKYFEEALAGQERR